MVKLLICATFVIVLVLVSQLFFVLLVIPLTDSQFHIRFLLPLTPSPSATPTHPLPPPPSAPPAISLLPLCFLFSSILHGSACEHQMKRCPQAIVSSASLTLTIYHSPSLVRIILTLQCANSCLPSLSFRLPPASVWTQ